MHVDDLQHRLDIYNESAAGGTEERFAVTLIDGEDVIVAICTPLMKRVHRFIKHSGELVFMDAGGSMHRHNYRLFLLLTHSVAGGLPLGVLIVPSEKASTITLALELYNKLLDNGSFYGREVIGPMVSMTDDSKSERVALAEVYPSAVMLLCIFLKTIGEHPTAIARRKAALGGRTRTYLGRTPRWGFAPEHGYAKRKSSYHALPAQGGHNSVKQGNQGKLREFLNSGKLREN